MKNLSIIINAVLGIALVVLYVLHFSAPKNGQTTENSGAVLDNSGLQVAYVNIDSIFVNYKLSVELNDALTAKQGKMRNSLEKEASSLEKEAQIFQDKVQRGIFLTQQRAEEAQQELIMRQQELQKLEYDYTQQLSTEQQKMTSQLFDSISNYINKYNSPEKYHIILAKSAGSGILYGSGQIDITNDILSGLNSSYSSKK